MKPLIELAGTGSQDLVTGPLEHYDQLGSLKDFGQDRNSFKPLDWPNLSIFIGSKLDCYHQIEDISMVTDPSIASMKRTGCVHQ